MRFSARLIAYIFHPLFITSYVMAFLIFFHPYAFTGFDPKTKVLRFINIVLCNAFFPAFAVLLLKLLGFISSMHLRTEKERIIPYIIAMIFYWWTWNVYKHLPDSPLISIQFLLGAFLALCGGWLCNIYFKISMHGIAMGGALMFFILFSFTLHPIRESWRKCCARAATICFKEGYEQVFASCLAAYLYCFHDVGAIE